MSKEEEKKLIDFSDDSDSDSDSSDRQPSKKGFQINKKFASEYEKRKRRQELVNAAQDGYGSDSDESSSESEDENAELLTPQVDLQILKVRFLSVHQKNKLICVSIIFLILFSYPLCMK